MSCFKDNQGRDYVVSLTMKTMKEIRDQLGCNISDLSDKETIKRLQDDFIFVIDCLYIACREQAEKYGLDDAQFGESLYGDAIEKAVDAFFQAFIDFFPKATRNRLEASRKLSEPMMKKALAALDNMLTVTDRESSGQG